MTDKQLKEYSELLGISIDETKEMCRKAVEARKKIIALRQEPMMANLSKLKTPNSIKIISKCFAAKSRRFFLFLPLASESPASVIGHSRCRIEFFIKKNTGS